MSNSFSKQYVKFLLQGVCKFKPCSRLNQDECVASILKEVFPFAAGKQSAIYHALTMKLKGGVNFALVFVTPLAKDMMEKNDHNERHHSKC